MAQIGPSVRFQSIGPAGAPDISFSNAYFVIQSPWGIDNLAQPVSSFAEFTKLYGGKNRLTAVASGLTADTYTVEIDDDVVQAYQSVKAYFDEKGDNSPGVAFINRVIATSSGPTAASKTYVAGPASGGFNTTFTAKWKGRDGGTVQVYTINPSPRKGVLTLQTGTVAVTSGTASVTGTGTSFVTGSTWNGWGIKIGTEYYTIQSVASTTSLTLDENASSTHTTSVFSVGNNTTACYVNAYHPQSGIREEWDLEPTTASAADISRKSQLLTVSLPAGLQLPKTTAPGATGAAKLNSGTPATADSYAATAADYVGTTSSAGVKTGLQVFNDRRLGTGFVMVPGQTSATVDTGIKSHCETYYRYGIYSTSSALTLQSAQTEMANVSTNFGAAWGPRIWAVDPDSTQGGSILVDNVGFIAGLWARMHRDYGGPSKSPAGIGHPFQSAVDVERQSNGAEIFDDAAAQTLADVYFNTIRSQPGTGVYSWGIRSLASDERYRQVQAGLIVCIVWHYINNVARTWTFEPIDPFGKLFARAKGDVDAIMFDLWSRGALYGTQPGKEPKKENAWFVVCNKGNNPDIAIGKGQIRVDVSMVPVPNAEAIDIPVFVAAPGFGAAAAGVF